MQRPIPALDDENRGYWTSGADGHLRILRCDHCCRFVHPPRAVCRYCLSDELTFQKVSGSGKVATCTVNYQQWFPEQNVPYVVARVALDDAPDVFLTTNIIDCDPESVRLGDTVRVVFEKHGDVFLPLFVKVE